MYGPEPRRSTTNLSPDQRRHGIHGSNTTANLRNRGEEVESDDARLPPRVTKGRDPPGQRCVYIPPGDHQLETYRLSTFTCFPVSPVSIVDLATAGFYYTGFKDQAKCFSCGTCVQGWTTNDSPSDPRWHEVDCPMTQGRDLRNVESASTCFRKLLKQLRVPAIIQGDNMFQLRTTHSDAASYGRSRDIANVTDSLDRVRLNENLPKLNMANVLDLEHKALLGTLQLNRETDRRKTFAKWPTYPAPYLPRTLAKEGFFYLGNLDRAQCFSCSGVLRNWSESDNVTEQHRRHFPNCRLHSGRDPRNEEMSEADRRYHDDLDRQKLSVLLPSGDISEPPDPPAAELRHLQNCLPCSNPQNPHMRSLHSRIASFRRWPATKTKATPEQMAKAGLFYLGEADKTKCFYCNGGLQNWDYNDEPWTEHAKWFPGCEYINQRKGTRFVKQITDSHPNLNRPKIRNPISVNDVPPFRGSPSQGTCHGEARHMDMFTMTGSAIAVNCDAVSKRPNAEPNEGQPKRARSSAEEDAALRQELMQKELSKLCRKCKEREADVVLLPCGHYLACSVCAPSMKRCINCNSNVTEVVKIYRA